MARKPEENRIITKVSQRALNASEHLALSLLLPGLGLLFSAFDKVFEAEAIDRKTGASAIGYGNSEEDAEFMAINKLTSSEEFRKPRAQPFDVRNPVKKSVKNEALESAISFQPTPGLQQKEAKMSEEYNRGYKRGFADAIAKHAQSLPSETDKFGLLEHAFINILLPGVGLLISLAESSREIHNDLDRGYIAGYRDGLQKLRNDREYNNLTD